MLDEPFAREFRKVRRWLRHWGTWGEHGEEGPWSGWLCNRLTGFIEQPTAVWVEPRLGRQRPLLWIQQDGHPLAVAQKHGVTAARMLELLAAYGHAPD